MARPRTPTKILELRGAFRKDPRRGAARANEPKNLPGVGAAPESLTAEQRQAWEYVVASIPAGVAKQPDRIKLEMISRLVDKMWAGTIKSSEMSLLSTLLGQFGLSPAERAKVAAEPAPMYNRFTGSVQ